MQRTYNNVSIDRPLAKRHRFESGIPPAGLKSDPETEMKNKQKWRINIVTYGNPWNTTGTGWNVFKAISPSPPPPLGSLSTGRSRALSNVFESRDSYG